MQRHRMRFAFFLALLAGAGALLASDDTWWRAAVVENHKRVDERKFDIASAAIDSLQARAEKEFGRESEAWAEFAVLRLRANNGLRRPPGGAPLSDCETATRLLERVRGSKSLELARGLAVLAKGQEYAGQIDKSIGNLERAVHIFEADENADPGWRVRAQVSLGNLYRGRGDFARAAAAYEPARKHLEKTLPIEDPARWNLTAVLSGCYEEMGLWEQFREASQAAVPGVRKNGDALRVAVLLGNVAKASYYLGDEQEARKALTPALAILDSLPPTIQQKLVLESVLAVDGAVAQMEGRDDAALHAFERTLRMSGTTGDSAIALSNMGEALNRQGQFVPADSLLRQAIRIAQRADPGALTSKVAFSRAANALDRGRLEEARGECMRAITLKDSLLGADHPEAAAAHALMAQIDFASKDPQSTVREALYSEAALQRHFALVGAALSERRMLRFASERPPTLDLALTEAASGNRSGPAGPVWDAVIRRRGQVLEELALRNRTVVASGDSIGLALADSLRLAERKLAALYYAVGTATRKKLETQTAIVQQYQQRIARRSVELRHELQNASLGFDAVANALPPGSALVGFVRYQHMLENAPSQMSKRSQADRGSRDRWPAKTSYLALALAAGSKVATVVPLGSSARIDTLVDTWRLAVSKDPEESEDRSAAERNCLRAGIALRRSIWDPLQPAIGKAQRVFVVPDGDLCLVNFVALPADSVHYLVENPCLVQVLDSERGLARGALDSHEMGSGLLAFADPDYEDATVSAADVENKRVYRGGLSPCSNLHDQHWTALPGTRREAQGIAALWKGSKLSAGRAATVFLDKQATEAAFKSRAPGQRVVHVATHGFFVDPDCDKDSGTTAHGSALENPLLLSGIVLAGVGRHETNGEDGMLTAEEIAALDLHGVEWVVLSTCGSGLGVVQAGEGVFGLRRAFSIAGAHTLVMSLWDVPDDYTTRWMQSLYKAHLVESRSTAIAARDATRSLLADLRSHQRSTHPYNWGAYIMVGGLD